MRESLEITIIYSIFSSFIWSNKEFIVSTSSFELYFEIVIKDMVGNLPEESIFFIKTLETSIAIYSIKRNISGIQAYIENLIYQYYLKKLNKVNND